ncbi:DUF4142 domain-containing protein [Niveispirillum sp.]|uniref:DUF4142 domain-containing protein n=1 Tax=Niveispirillum sp. TaxID=1917217 RepID=UPI001B4FD84A|nr:DUF4142 domain-containing protein [Niveispirillum sp.]MBP7334885.1 DUF4142 domain-containing protein [Niveispirillum sp.]
MRRLQQALLIGAVLCAGSAMAQVPPSPHANPQVVPPGSDKPEAQEAPARTDQKKLVTLIAQGGMAEVAAGQLAQSRARLPSVRRFADQMVFDHTKGNADLAAAAAQANIVIPSALAAEHQAKVMAMGNVADADFDQAYIQQQVKDHRSMIELHRQLQDTSTPALADYARSSLPKLEEHLRLAQGVERDLKDKKRE